MNIALVQLGRIGDMVLLTSAIPAIKERYPDANIYVIAGHSNHIVVNNNTLIKKVLVYDKNPLKILFFILKFKRIHFDYYIDPKDHFSNESHLLAYLANADIRIGYNDDEHNTFDIPIDNDKENINLHFLERICNCLKYLDINKIGKPNIILENGALNEINRSISGKYILINISASNRDRMWQMNKWIELVKMLQGKIDTQFVLSSAPEHSVEAEEISSGAGVYHFPPAKLSVITALIAKAEFLISPDTSLIHIASAFDIPVVALTNNVKWNVAKFRPLSSENIVILPDKVDGFVGEIGVETVFEEVVKIWKLIKIK